jgi:hypothetical protein
MSRRVTVPLLLVTTAVLLTACGSSGPSEEDKRSIAAFAETSCSGLAEVYDAEDALNDLSVDIEAFPTAEEQHAAAIDEVQGFIDLLRQSRDDVAESVPAVDEGEDGQDGEAIVELFTTYYDAWADAATEKLDAFSAEVPEFGGNEDGVLIAATDLSFDVSEGSIETLEFPYGEIEDQDVIQAIDDESTCRDVVSVW